MCYFIQQPLSGSGETPSPKCPADTSDNGKRCMTLPPERKQNDKTL